MKVWEYLDFFARCYGIPADRRRRMIGDLLDLVDLGPKRDTYVQGLSRGMQQRLCLAHALVHDPQVLLLDEPASGLDPRARVELRELLRELRALGKTILVSSHILPELEELCTSVAIIDRGQVLAQGRVADIERRLRVGAVFRARVLGDEDGDRGGPAPGSTHQPDVVTAQTCSRTATIEIGFHGDDEGAARAAGGRGRRRPPGRDVLPRRERPRGAVPPGHRAGPGRRAAGAVGDEPPVATPADRAASARCATSAAGIAAVGVKELRGRMRGRRAFVMHHDPPAARRRLRLDDRDAHRSGR